MDLNKIRFSYLHYILQYSFWFGFESEKLESLYWHLEKTQGHSIGPLPWSRDANTKGVNILCPADPSVKAKSQVFLFASWGNFILKMQHSTTRQAKQKISANLDHHWSKWDMREVSWSEAWSVAHLQATSYTCAAERFVTLRAVTPAGRHRVGCLLEHAQDQQSSSCIAYPIAEDCSPAWSRNRNTKEVDVAINSALRTITGCLKPTPRQHLPILAGIAPTSVRRNAATFRLALKYALTEHFNSNLLRLKTRPRLKSRRSIAQSTIELMESFGGMSLSHSGLNISGSRSGRSQGSHLIPFHHPKWETPTLGSAALRGVNWTTSERESDASGNHYNRWKMAPDPRFWGSSNRGTYHKWTLWLFPDAWSESRSCFTPNGFCAPG